MTEEQALLQAIQNNPNDVDLRLVFADWLEERGDQRAELVRLIHTLTQSVEIPGRSGLETRLRTLLNDGVQPIGPFWTNSIGMKFAWIPPGVFLMGSPSSEKGRYDEEILHKVTLTQGFWMGVHLVTEDQWRVVMNEGPNHGECVPIECISWDDSQRFILELRKLDAKPYRLPTEAGWEYACRAGTTTAFYFGETITNGQATCNGYESPWSATDASPVGSFPANAFGLHDMHGNLWEWCEDYHGAYPQQDVVDPLGEESGWMRVHRGGSWIDKLKLCRSAFRFSDWPEHRSEEFGFRVCFSLRLLKYIIIRKSKCSAS
jgi:uncharacterized protein (TIGR02996 family)